MAVGAGRCVQASQDVQPEVAGAGEKVPAVGLWGCSLCETGFADAIALVATLPGRCHILEPMAGADCAAKCVKRVYIVRATGGTCEGRA